ncbi:MAG: hypothetical protein RL115_1901, partial [Bacteroidota bacterium]
LSAAPNKQDKARWEYLLAQLFELSGKYPEAEKYYTKVSSHTVDPILDIYARLYAIRVNKNEEKAIEKNVSELLKMAKRDRYQAYQDIIYYMAAQMHLQGNNVDEAMKLLLKSTVALSNNASQRNRSFLQLATLAYEKKLYKNAAAYYDSLNLTDTSIRNVEAIVARKTSLKNLVTHLIIAERQDSLQHIAAMPEDERKEWVKKLVKQLRKEQGLKEDAAKSTIVAAPISVPNTLFQPGGNAKGEWYFYNASSKTRGLSEFKSRWGNRPNVDNWRRGSTIIAGGANQTLAQQALNNSNGKGDAGLALNFDNLYNNLPLTAAALQLSNDSLQQALFEMGKVYIQQLEDCVSGTATFELLRSKFSQFAKMDEVLFNLYYCYQKNGETAKAAPVKNLLSNNFSASNFTTIVNTGKDPSNQKGNEAATKAYESIYDLFIEGKFAAALSAKKEADSKFGKSYWTPQLLYIESVYYIRQREDSTAIKTLEAILQQFGTTPLAAKATNLIDVLRRRAAIEEELSKMQITRAIDTQNVVTSTVVTPPVAQPNIVAPALNNIKDTVTQQLPPATVNTPQPIDTAAVKPIAVAPLSAYNYSPAEEHFVVLVLNKVDPVFVNEAKNAFIRYNRETYYNKSINAALETIDAENRILLLSPFTNEQEALAYVDKAKPKTSTEILPWLKGGKYSFLIITSKNLSLLKEKKDVEAFRAFLNQFLPGKF